MYSRWRTTPAIEASAQAIELPAAGQDEQVRSRGGGPSHAQELRLTRIRRVVVCQLGPADETGALASQRLPHEGQSTENGML